VAVNLSIARDEQLSGECSGLFARGFAGLP
jgi:hypothetical protein